MGDGVTRRVNAILWLCVVLVGIALTEIFVAAEEWLRFLLVALVPTGALAFLVYFYVTGGSQTYIG